VDRRTVLKSLSASTAVAASGALSTAIATTSGRRPNFVIVLCDDLGYGDLTSFGGRIFKTANLDRLAREGTALTNYYAPANL
jgi:arylsulfatase A